jgi:chitinase
MRFFLIPFIFVFAFACTLKKSEDSSPHSTEQNGYKIIAYVNRYENNWGDNFAKARKITHINYAFANIKNGRVVLGGDRDAEEIQKLLELKSVNKELKVLISVGGWSWSKNFSDAVLTEESRQVFANSAVEFMLDHKIDGIDLDWEYPGQPGAGNIYSAADKENFTLILKLIRSKLDSLSTPNHSFLLTIATGANQKYLDHTNMREAHKYLDFINIMTYDFYGGGDVITGHHANLSRSKYENNLASINAQLAVKQHIAAGIPANKIVLGVPFYGKWWDGVINKNNGLYQSYSGESGTYDYRIIADSLLNKNGFKSYWDSTALSPYLWNEADAQFVTYENKKSIVYKVSFVKDNQLGGIMFWQFNGDDGTLLETIHDNLR